jgi:hypothetical protein
MEQFKISTRNRNKKQYVTTTPPLRILQGVLHKEIKEKKKGQIESIKPQEKKRQGIRE